ncbi:MAG: helix-turn-helix transcriptional regulator [Bacillota bacterium]
MLIFEIIDYLARKSSREEPCLLSEIVKAVGMDGNQKNTVRKAIHDYVHYADRATTAFGSEMNLTWSGTLPSIVVCRAERGKFTEIPVGELDLPDPERGPKGRTNAYGYYLEATDNWLSPGETRFLQEAVYTYACLSSKQVAELITKLDRPLPRWQRGRFKDVDPFSVGPRMPVSMFHDIEKISKAIEYKECISFTYLKYDADNGRIELVPKAEYRVRPLALMAWGGEYYLVCSVGDHVINLRLDKMRDVQTIAEDAGRFIDVNQISHKYEDVKMFAGDKIDARIRVKREILNSAVDTFGLSRLRVTRSEADEVEISVSDVSWFGVRVWVLQHLGHCELLLPADLRVEITKVVQEQVRKYGVDVAPASL